LRSQYLRPTFALLIRNSSTSSKENIVDKNWVVASVVAAVALFVLNLLVGAVGGDFMSATMAAEGTWQSIVGHLFAGSVLALVLGWRGTGDAADGAKAGATLGILHALSGSFAGMEAFDVMALIGALVAGIVVVGVSGAAVAMAPTGGGDA